ncbi:MAG: hypothetical protein SFV54_25590 [Bryobacteraceae bacterium]|nr:hypothetical protein [Bryobacteraceae bacterium]
MSLSLPVTQENFRRTFLNGAGTLEFATDRDLWSALFRNGGKFTDDVDRIADLSVSAGTKLTFGKKGGLALGLNVSGSAMHQMQVYFPGADAEGLRAYGLRDLLTGDQLCLRLSLGAKGDAALSGSFPAGPLSATFGVAAGGSVGYERLKFYRQDQTVADIIGDFFKTMRLPQQADTVSEIPDPGEVLITHLSGYLKLNAGLRWGYSVTGSKSFEANQLKLDLEYAVRAMAAVSVGYQMAGEFTLESRRGSRPNWVRLVVRKSRSSRFSFAADFGLDADVKLDGLPADADEFLSKLIGSDAERILGYFDKARKYANVEELEKEAGKLAKGFIHKLAQEQLGAALTNANLDAFLAKMSVVTEAFANLDKRILGLYQDFLNGNSDIAKVMGLLASVASRDRLQSLVNTESLAFALLRRLLNERAMDALLDDAEFRRFLELAQKADQFFNGSKEKDVKEFVDRVRQEFPLRSLFGELRKLKTTKDVVNLADERLQGLVERLVGKSFDEIKKSDAGKALEEIKKGLDAVDSFKDRWYAKLRAAAKQNFTMKASLAYSRASANTALVDVEINLADDAGRRLFEDASKGDLTGVMQNFDTAIAKLNQGVMTHQLSESMEFTFNIMGWQFVSIATLLQDTEHTIEERDGGLLHIFATDTGLKRFKRSGRDKEKETLASHFLLRTVAETMQPPGRDGRYVIDTLKSMAVRYELAHEDEKTDPEELTLYLSLAETLGLLPDRAGFVEDLRRQFPGGFGKVKVQYVVRYDDQAVRNAFALPSNEIGPRARGLLRQLVTSSVANKKNRSDTVLIAFAYLQDMKPTSASSMTIPVPSWFHASGAGSIGTAGMAVLRTLFNKENSYVRALTELDQLVDRVNTERRAVPLDDLTKAARNFVSMADDIDEFFAANGFFGIFDRLSWEGGGKKGARESAITIEITPPAGQPVTKVLTAGPTAAEMLDARAMQQEQPLEEVRTATKRRG